jgi:hypothetical protein
VNILEYQQGQNKITEEQDQKSVSSVSVPGAGLFSEPFLRDLDLIWQVDHNIHCNYGRHFNPD